MIGRKIFALLVLIGTIGALVLFYMYFFVYYTSGLTIQSNVEGYRVELFAIKTAQKTKVECPLSECVIQDIPPFQYNVTFSKEGYETQIVEITLSPRSSQEFILELQRKAVMEKIELEERVEVEESIQSKIERLKEENAYYARFALGDEKFMLFSETPLGRLEMSYKVGDTEKTIGEFEMISKESIEAERISFSSDIALRMGKKIYLFQPDQGKIFALPFEMEVRYIKTTPRVTEYYVVTEKGTFLYNIQTEQAEFQYLFSDFLRDGEMVIGVILPNETEKKENFGFQDEKDTLIVRYHIPTKERKILLRTSMNIEKIEWRNDEIVFFSGTEMYRLSNYQK